MSLVTKKALASSLKKLMMSSTLDKITVVDVAAECGVNRQTFYYHFKDIYDLVEWICTTEAFHNIDSFISYGNWQEGYLKIFEYVGENREFSINCMKSSGREYLEQYLYQVTYKLLIDVINELADGRHVSEKNKKFIADFYCYSLIGILLSWIREGFKENPRDLVDQLDTLIGGNIKRSIEKYI